MAQDSSKDINTFDKSLNEDIKDFHLPSNQWTQARNAINNSISGDLGKLGNEPATLQCVSAPYTIIGFIHIIEDKWAVYSTDGTNSEIGLFIEDNCGTTKAAYIKVVNDPCLNFKLENLVIGVSRPTSTCTYKLYWDDGINPSRTLEVDVDNPARNEYTNENSTIPWVQNCQIINSCNICTNTSALDCDKIRLAQFMSPICPRVENGFQGGNLLNGSYMVAMAYAVNGQKISDWYVSNVQSIWTHQNVSGSIDVFIDSIDLDYDEIIVAIVYVVNQQAVARNAGVYSTRQTRLSFDIIQDSWPAIPIEQIPIMTPIVDKSDAMYNVGDYLIRVGPTSKEDFNYQPLANQIRVKWQSVEYPADYYYKGNNNTGYMRDEVYAFFIRWIYDTGDKSASYHIPGRPAFANDITPAPLNNALAGETQNWQVNNTATIIPGPTVTLPDGGVVIQEGYMGYWESTERYPDNKPEIWNASEYCWSSLNPGLFPGCVEPVPPIPYTGTVGGLLSYDLCGKPIRHHKFPEDGLTSETNRFNEGIGDKIRIMGVKFENVRAPRTLNGDLIPGIIGYEILRGTRNGNKSIIAKGIINNMHEYDIQGTTKRGLYPNYPYNDLRDDPFLSTSKTSTISFVNPGSTNGGTIDASTFNPMKGGITNLPNPYPAFSKNYITFHSPETTFANPFLSAKELRIYQGINGDVLGKFDISEEHPKEKLVTDMVFIIASIAGIGVAALAVNGNRRVHRVLPSYQGYSQEPNYFTKNTYNLTDNGQNNQLPYTTTDTNNPPGAGPNVTFIPAPPQLAITTNTNNNTTGTTDLTVPQSTNIISQPAPSHQGSMTSALGLVDTTFNSYDGPNPVTAANKNGTILTTTITSGTTADTAQEITYQTSKYAGALHGVSKGSITIENEDGAYQPIPAPLKGLVAVPMFLMYYSQGTDNIIKLIRSLLTFKDYALRYHSHGFYKRTEPKPTVFRTSLIDQQYIDPQLVDYNADVRINNLYRQKTVVLLTQRFFGSEIALTSVKDHTRYDVSGGSSSLASSFWPNNIFGNPDKSVENLVNKYINGANTTDGAWNDVTKTGGQVCSSWYAGLKIRIDNQYGQLNRIIQVPVDNCYTSVTINKQTKQITSGSATQTIFGGDIYINRYTEKNTFFFFYDWLYGQPDGAQLDYLSHRMVAYPKYWANFNEFQTSDFTTSIFNAITNFLAFNLTTATPIIVPSSFYALDGPGSAGNWLTNITTAFKFNKEGWFYLFNSGIRDFFVESEYNLAQRDFGDLPEQKFYDPYKGGDTKDLFNTNIIKAGNYYKYDQSLSISKLFINYASWASTQSPSYNPYDASTCFVYQPTRVIYSLPAQYEGIRDGWRVFLPNNYYDFINRVTCIKPVNKSGAMIFFDAASPVQFQGTDQLQTDLGTKLTIGDGGLFSQPMQQIVNTDASYEYASCQNRLSVINTPVGIYWMSQNQGKIFLMAGGLKEVSNINMKWWFAQYLPYTLTQDFPDFELIDNPVTGIGCQATYDNENGLIYFCKKDYKLKSEYKATDFEYLGGYKFKYKPSGLNFDLISEEALLFFNDTSWTTSYDPKTDGWLSYHDWHPTLTIPGKNTFMSVSPFDKKSIWIHNERCDLYCNYYGKDYPFEVEFTVNTGGVVNTLRSIEYIMEAYKYASNCYDRFHVLDFNFDEATLYNTEQVSGLLKLNLTPKNNPTLMLQYPIINPTNIDMLFSKVENKYRFNQFWDITDNRGEYNLAAQRPIWNTAPNGYVRVLNSNNLNYNKPELQRKKFRHYTVSVLLRRKVSGNIKMLIMLADVKNLLSPR